jgi:hypothetical protein
MSDCFGIIRIGFLNDLFCGRSYIAAPAELSISFLLDEKSTVVPVRLAGERAEGKRKVSYGDARSNSERAAPSLALRDELAMRDARCSEAVPVGSLALVEKVKSELELKAAHRHVIFRFER